MKVRIATRTSPLAVWQARHVARLLRDADPAVDVELVEVSTVGDRDRSNTLASFGGTGVFTREVQRAVLDGRAEVAVHSLKDLPTASTEGLALAAVPEREDRFDALVLPVGHADADPSDPLAALRHGARVATGSPRRKAELLHRRPDLDVAGVRGNVGTRLEKLDGGEFDGMILAAAGLKRLELADRMSARLDTDTMFPAVGQGALGLECRADDGATGDALARVTTADAVAEVTAERAMLARLGAGCHAPVGALARVSDADGRRITLTGVALAPDGSRRFEQTCSDVALDGPSAAVAVGHAVADRLLAAGADAYM